MLVKRTHKYYNLRCLIKTKIWGHKFQMLAGFNNFEFFFMGEKYINVRLIFHLKPQEQKYGSKYNKEHPRLYTIMFWQLYFLVVVRIY